MLRTFWRAAWAALAVNGLFMIWLARYGSLWEPENAQYLGWLQLYVLRGGLFVIGGATVVAGVWCSWLAYTRPARILLRFLDDVRHDRELDRECLEHYGSEAYVPHCWRDYLFSLRHLLPCMLGRHDPLALWYSNGGEDGPRGTTCSDCGERLSRYDIVDHAECARLRAIREADIDRMERECAEYDLRPSARVLAFARPEPDGGPDPLRSIAPDDGCFTQGSDPVRRASHCDKEA